MFISRKASERLDGRPIGSLLWLKLHSFCLQALQVSGIRNAGLGFSLGGCERQRESPISLLQSFKLERKLHHYVTLTLGS